MSGDVDTATAGIDSRIGWPIGGALGGGLGAVAFGLVISIFDPTLVEESIPAFYGFDPDPLLGWGLHVVHGAVLGLVFALVVTRSFVLGVLRTRPETDALSRTDLTLRLVGAGVVFSFAIWAILPMIALPVIGGTFGEGAADAFLGMAVETMIAHAAYGLVLGVVFALLVDLRDRDSESPIE